MKNKILIGLFLLIPSLVFASEFTPKYSLEIPSIASRDWQPAISRDIISIDAVLQMVSDDSAFVDSGTSVKLRTTTDNVIIGGTTPLTKLEVIGFVSCDGIRLDLQTASPDTATLKGGALILSRDVTGVISLLYFDTMSWHAIRFL